MVVGARPRSATASSTDGVTTPSRTSQTCDRAVGASSSSPSSPRNTSALVPRVAKTPATSGAIRASATPTAVAPGWAGLVSGPRKLNEVAMPSSRRATPTCRIAGWNTCAKQKVIPTSRAIAAIRSTGWSSRIPSTSSTSADPDDDDEARFPCLTTVVPVPATTSAAIVEMLTVCARSPPVPTRSTVRPGTENRTECASIVFASAVSSSTVSPLQRSATRNPARRAGGTSPDMISSIAQDV